MDKKKLLILDTKQDFDKKFDFYDVIYLSSGKIIEGKCNIISFWNYNFKLEKQKLIKGIAKYTNINKEKFQSCLEINNFRNDRYKQYYKTVKILYLKKIVKKYKNNIKIITDDNEFYNSYKSLTEEKNIKFIKNKSCINSVSFLKTNLFFLIKVIIVKMFLIFENKKILNEDSIYFSIFPLFFKKKKNYLYKKKNNIYLNTFLSDESHIQENIFKLIKRIFIIKNNKFFFHIEKYISFKDLIIFFKSILRNRTIYQKINKKKLIIDKVNFTDSYINLFKFSYIKFHKTEILLNAITNFLINNKIKKFNYFLFEYAFGIQIHQNIKSRIPKLRTIGYQHGLNSRNFIWEDISTRYKNSFPDKIILKSKLLEKIYKNKYKSKINLENNNLMDREIRNYKRILSNNKKYKYNYVVLLGLHDFSRTINLLTNFKNKRYKFFIKPHPKINLNNYNFSNNIKLINKIPNKKIFKSIILSQSSSLIISFLENNIPFKLLKDNLSFNLLSDFKLKNKKYYFL